VIATVAQHLDAGSELAPVHLHGDLAHLLAGEIAHLEPEVHNFDSAAALDGGADGLALYRAWAPWLKRLVPDGWIVLEVGYDQADAVAAIVAGGMGQAVAEAHIYSDVAGMRRCVAMRARAGTHA
jgi:release factor glutamine methyltransferase